jgi:hypothetical protein
VNRINKLLILAAFSFSLSVALPAFGSEQKLKAAQITNTLQGNTAYLRNGATQSFFKDGRTLYLSASGSLERGSWNTQGDKYCSQWSGRWSCYEMSGDGKQAITWTQGETTYPARMVSGIHLNK